MLLRLRVGYLLFFRFEGLRVWGGLFWVCFWALGLVWGGLDLKLVLGFLCLAWGIKALTPQSQSNDPPKPNPKPA